MFQAVQETSIFLKHVSKRKLARVRGAAGGEWGSFAKLAFGPACGCNKQAEQHQAHETNAAHR